MTPFEAFQEYSAIKLHFNNNTYDYVKFGGKLKLTIDTYNKRKDKLFFEKLSRNKNVKELIISNIIKNKKIWIKDLAYNSSCEKVLTEWMKKTQSLTYTFKEELKKLDSEFNKNFICHNNEHPLLLRLFLVEEISLETITILYDLVGFDKEWDEKLKYDVIWDDTKMLIQKYKAFLHYDKSNLREVCLDYFNDL